MVVLGLSIAVLLILSLPMYTTETAKKANAFRFSAKTVFNDNDLVIESSRLIEEDGGSLLSRKLHHRFLFKSKALINNFLKYFDLDYLLISGDSNLRHSTGRVGVIGIVGFIGLLLGLYLLFFANRKLFLLLVFIWFWSLLPGAVTYESPHSLRSLNALLPIVVIAGAGLSGLVKFKLNKLVVFLAGLLFIFQFYYYLEDYYLHYPRRSALDWQAGYQQAVEAAETVAQEHKLPIYFTDRYFQPYIYYLLYSNYPLDKFQEQRREEFLETGRFEFGGHLSDQVYFANENSFDFQTKAVFVVGPDLAAPVDMEKREIKTADDQLIFKIFYEE